MGSIFRVLFYQPTFNLLIIFYELFASNLGWAIVAVAALSRLITYPITKNQINSAKKGKEFQAKYEKIKKKYAKNKEKQNEELMKLQSKYFPSQIAGCLPIIILIILLIQVRGGIRNLVDQGWHSFNEVAYVESFKKNEDYIEFEPSEDLELGEHTLKVEVESEDGNRLEKEYEFEIVEDKEARREELINEENSKSQEQKEEERKVREEDLKSERDSDISLFSEVMRESSANIPVSKFLIFTSESRQEYLLTDRKPDFEFYLRPPSNQKILTEKVKVFLDENEVTEQSTITQGDPINLDFLGIDLSKVAADFSWSDSQIIPYVVLALLVGGSQYATSQILTGLKAPETKKKKDKSKKKKKDEEEMPDMSELMAMSSKQMMIMFPLLTVITSLGYWGGSNIFPAGLSIFWTVQSLFVIIQQVLMNKEKVIKWIKSQFFERGKK